MSAGLVGARYWDGKKIGRAKSRHQEDDDAGTTQFALAPQRIAGLSFCSRGSALHQIGQLGDVDGNPPRFIAREQPVRPPGNRPVAGWPLMTLAGRLGLLTFGLRDDHVSGPLAGRLPLLDKGDVFVGVLRAQRIEHPTSYEASLLNLCFPSYHLLAPIPELSNSTIPRKCPQFAAVSPFCPSPIGGTPDATMMTARHHNGRDQVRGVSRAAGALLCGAGDPIVGFP